MNAKTAFIKCKKCSFVPQNFDDLKFHNCEEVNMSGLYKQIAITEEDLQALKKQAAKNAKMLTQLASKENVGMSKGKKYDTGKVRMELLSSKAITELAKVLTFGASKYDANNWRKGIAWTRVIGAVKRHMAAFEDGVDKDEESGLSHIAHAMCGLMFLLEFEQTHAELDDRYKGETNEGT